MKPSISIVPVYSRAKVTQRAALLFSLLACTSLYGHDSRPLYVEIEQLTEQRYSLAWKVPGAVAANNLPRVTFASPCELLTGELQATRATGTNERQLYRCAVDPAAVALSLYYPQGNPSLATMVRTRLLDGSPGTTYLAPEVDRLVLGADAGAVIWQYLQLGVEHIIKGIDHLLFVVCLVWLAGSWRQVFWAITGFTVAHSITLALSALGILVLPVAVVEAAIALSIVFLAAEICRDERPTLMRRFPALVSGVFGLLHGFGFAAVLSEIGLPSGEQAAALFAFNVGVEIGQLLFVSGLLLALHLLRRFGDAIRVRGIVMYPLGTLAGFWFWQRLVGMLNLQV